MEHPSHHHYSRTNQCRDRVKLGAQHGRDFSHKHIAHHAASDSGQHAEQRRRNRSGVKGQRFTRARNRKESESGGVEHQYRAAQPVDDSIPIERNQPGKDRDNDISPVADGRRRNRTDHHIASDAPRVACGERQNENSKEIEPVLHSSRRAAEGKHERTPKIEGNQQRVYDVSVDDHLASCG